MSMIMYFTFLLFSIEKLEKYLNKSSLCLDDKISNNFRFTKSIIINAYPLFAIDLLRNFSSKHIIVGNSV